MIRSITGLGAGKGPFISIHDGFQGEAQWARFLFLHTLNIADGENSDLRKLGLNLVPFPRVS